MTSSPNDLSDNEVLNGFVAEYLDGDLPSGVREKYNGLIKNPASAQVPEHFLQMRGKLQLAMQTYYLKESDLSELRSFVQDPEATATQENIKIEQLGRKVVVSNILRRVSIVLICAGVIGYLVWTFAPSREAEFKALEYLAYEAVALEEDPLERLNLPSSDLKEIRQYLVNYPGLDFKPFVLRSISNNWVPDGATVINYEVAKVTVVQYAHNGTSEKLFHFIYAGDLSDLPPSAQGRYKDLNFQTYATDQHNFIAWEPSPGVVSLLVGKRSAPDLAEMAIAGP
jgi:hypothetical protein